MCKECVNVCASMLKLKSADEILRRVGFHVHEEEEAAAVGGSRVKKKRKSSTGRP